jgi:hypothetical protein
MERNQKTVLALIGCALAGAGALVVLCLAAAGGYLFLQRRQTSLPPSQAYPDVQRISVEDAYAAYLDGTAVFVDARPESDYERRHIPGALSIPLDEVGRRMDELDPQAWIITYCV